MFRLAAGMQIEVQIEERYPEVLSLAPRCKGENRYGGSGELLVLPLSV